MIWSMYSSAQGDGEIKQCFFWQAGEDGEITAEEQVQMLLDAKLQCLQKVSMDDPAGRKSL